MNARSAEPRVLIFSLRNIFPTALFRCPHYEFEDIICEIDSAELWAPTLDAKSLRSTFAMRLAFHAPITLNPGIRGIPAKTDYDLFFAICGGIATPYDLLMLNAVGNAKDKCRTSICLVDELW